MTPEGAVLRQIMDYLAARHVLAFRMNTLAMPTADGKRFIKAGVPGMADVLAFPTRERGVDDNGAWCSFTEIKPTWIEVKAPNGKQSPLQKSFQEMVEREGHRYILARDVMDLEEI